MEIHNFKNLILENLKIQFKKKISKFKTTEEKLNFNMKTLIHK
jgi:hypothetical protein